MCIVGSGLGWVFIKDIYIKRVIVAGTVLMSLPATTGVATIQLVQIGANWRVPTCIKTGRNPVLGRRGVGEF